jgi:hypothetical protein
MHPARKQARSETADGSIPAWQWLYDAGVKPGGFFVETKARIMRAMTDTSWPEKPRVWACLALHTMGFNQELAVKMERGSTVPLRQVDIARETGVPIKSVHRCVVELQADGWLLRETGSDGELKILCFAVPRRASLKRSEEDPAPEVSRKYDGLPENLAYWLRHLKLGVPSDPEKLAEAGFLAVELTARVDRLREISRPEPDQMALPGVPVNPVRVARLTKSKSRAAAPGSARETPKTGEVSRAGQKSPSARERTNKEEITEIKKAAGQAGRHVPNRGAELACLPAESFIQLVEKTILASGICAELKVLPDRALIERIAVKLNGCSPEGLRNRIHVRFDSIKSLGILEKLAEDVAESDGSPSGNGKPSKTDEVEALALRNLKRTGRIFA